MPAPTYTVPTADSPTSTEEPKIITALAEIKSILTGNIDADNAADGWVDADMLSATLATSLGLSAGGVVSRGKSIIATEEARSNTSYGTLTTPDRVQSVVLPTDGLMVVTYDALMKGSVAAAGRAAIFLNSDQLKVAHFTGGAPQVQEATSDSTPDRYGRMTTTEAGLGCRPAAGGADSTVTTGLIVSATSAVGGVTYLWAAAGTYTVSVQYKATSGSVTAKERKLWVWTMGF